MVTVAVASRVPAGALSAVVTLAGVSVIAVGEGGDTAAIVYTVWVADIARALETIER